MGESKYGEEGFGTSGPYGSSGDVAPPFPPTPGPEAEKRRIFTSRGPLVKGWGDGTPATIEDVTVTVNGTEVNVESVNPYLGEIILENEPATANPTVLVDYKWMFCPLFPMVLNTPGAGLNTWGNGDRFPIRVGLIPINDRPQPIQIGHRYVGFEKAYTAALNSPTTLLLNQNPHAFSQPQFQIFSSGLTETYEGTEVPTASDPAWSAIGTDTGAPNVGAGTYTVVDAESGGFDPDDETAVVYHRPVDFTLGSNVFIVGRFVVDSNTPDGVFTGVGFGMHDSHNLYMLGALLVNDVEHVGMLLDARRPHEIESWSVGPAGTATATSQTEFSVATTEIPSTAEAGEKIQILEGSQAGVYTVESVVEQTDGTTTITLTTELPENVKLYGNNPFTFYWEMNWSESLSTFRLEVDPDDETAVFSMSGEDTATVVSLSDVTLPPPAETSLLFPVNDEEAGEVFWGSLSRRGVSESTWSFFRYGVVPEVSQVSGHDVVTLTEMDTLPEEEGWFLNKSYGTSIVDSTGLRVLLKSDAGSDDLKVTRAYSKIENFLTPSANWELSSIFRVESGNLGAGDAQISITDTRQDIRLGSLLYVEDATADPYRQLFSPPSVSMTGLITPVDQGWVETQTGLSISNRNDVLRISQSDSATGIYTTDLDTSPFTVTNADTGSRYLEARFAVKSYTASGDTSTGIVLYGEVGVSPTFRQVGMELMDSGGIRLWTDDGTTTVVTYSYTWDDGEEHTYRLAVDVGGATVSLFVDDVVQTPTQALGSFSAVGTNNTLVAFGQINTDTSGAVDSNRASLVEWAAVNGVAYPPTTALRTLGVWLGEDEDDIDQWKLPRLDSSTAANSEQVGPSIQAMDWTSDVEVRLVHDPSWGVSVFRPDLGTPPFYVPENPPDAGKGHTTEIIEPSAAWINVETEEIPKLTSLFGLVSFGALDMRSVTQQRWDKLRYRIFNHFSDDVAMPHHMTLNQYNVTSSGERLIDVTPEQFDVQVTSSTTLSLTTIHQHAEYVYKIIDPGLPSTILPNQWDFDVDSQTLTLKENDDGSAFEFSSDSVIVTVVFKPGSKVSTTYLQNQPWQDSSILLNEGTPPFHSSQVGDATRTVVAGSQIGGGGGDPYQVVEFVDDSDLPFEALTQIEVNNEGEEGLLSSICELILPDNETDDYIADGDQIFDEDGVGTGTYLGEEIFDDGGSGTGTYLGRPTGAFVMSLGGYEETIDLTGADSTPPSDVFSADPNPDDTPQANGAVLMDLGGVVSIIP